MCEPLVFFALQSEISFNSLVLIKSVSGKKGFTKHPILKCSRKKGLQLHLFFGSTNDVDAKRHLVFSVCHDKYVSWILNTHSTIYLLKIYIYYRTLRKMILFFVWSNSFTKLNKTEDPSWYQAITLRNPRAYTIAAVKYLSSNYGQ